MNFEKQPGNVESWTAMASQLSSIGRSTTPREAVVTSVLRLLVAAEDCQSITITLRDTSGAYCADLATLSLDGYEMTLKHSNGARTTSVTLQHTEPLEW